MANRSGASRQSIQAHEADEVSSESIQRTHLKKGLTGLDVDAQVCQLKPERPLFAQEAQMEKAAVASTGGGRPLERPVQSHMEQALGANFSNVRVHEDSSAESMGAQAYARGEHIHFAPGRYNPSTAEGQTLLGHELTHVVQQREGRVTATQQAFGLPINDAPELEHEAERMGEHAASMGGGAGSHAEPEHAAPTVSASSGGPIQRSLLLSGQAMNLIAYKRKFIKELIPKSTIKGQAVGEMDEEGYCSTLWTKVTLAEEAGSLDENALRLVDIIHDGSTTHMVDLGDDKQPAIAELLMMLKKAEDKTTPKDKEDVKHAEIPERDPMHIFVDGKPRAEDINQGHLGDCFMLAPLLSIVRNDPKHITGRLISSVTEESVTFNFFYKGSGGWKPTAITVDHTLAYKGGELLGNTPGSKASGQVPIWASLIEKAFAIYAERYGVNGKGLTSLESGYDIIHKGGFARETYPVFYGDAGAKAGVEGIAHDLEQPLKANPAAIDLLFRFRDQESHNKLVHLNPSDSVNDQIRGLISLLEKLRDLDPSTKQEPKASSQSEAPLASSFHASYLDDNPLSSMLDNELDLTLGLEKDERDEQTKDFSKDLGQLITKAKTFLLESRMMNHETGTEAIRELHDAIDAFQDKNDCAYIKHINSLKEKSAIELDNYRSRILERCNADFRHAYTITKVSLVDSELKNVDAGMGAHALLDGAKSRVWVGNPHKGGAAEEHRLDIFFQTFTDIEHMITDMG